MSTYYQCDPVPVSGANPQGGCGCEVSSICNSTDAAQIDAKSGGQKHCFTSMEECKNTCPTYNESVCETKGLRIYDSLRIREAMKKNGWAVALGAVLLVALVVGAVYVVRRRRSRPF